MSTIPDLANILGHTELTLEILCVFECFGLFSFVVLTLIVVGQPPATTPNAAINYVSFMIIQALPTFGATYIIFLNL